MSLFSAIQQANSGLQASQLGLQVVGNNIANANTPGYIRQRLELTPTNATRQGALLIGHGVRPTGVTQVIDKALAERLLAADSAVAGGATMDRAYQQLENLIGRLDGEGLSNQLTLFNNALHDLSTQPNDRSLRDFVIQQGESLALGIRTTYESAQQLQSESNQDIKFMANEMNRLIEQIAGLNVEIATVEGGRVLGSDASGLREQRYGALRELAQFVDIHVQEQPSGNVSVFVGGDYLVSEGNHREVAAAISPITGGFEIRIAQTDSPLETRNGKVFAMMQARNEVFGGFLRELDQFAGALSRSVNEVHSQGQGRIGFDSLVSTNRGQAGVPLRQSGLPTTPGNGSFDITLVDSSGAPLSTHRIEVRATGQVGDATLDSVAASIDAIAGLSARINSEGRLEVNADSPFASFTFGEDTSGFVAAVGLNTFFVGNGALGIDVNPLLRTSSDYLAISSDGMSQDTQTLVNLIDLVDRPLESIGGRTIRGLFDQNVASLGQKISLQKSLSSGARDFLATLESQHLGITGVNIDEETVQMLAYNRAFQASAKVISTANEMLEVLMAL